MNTIYKYTLSESVNEIKMPQGSIPLTVQEQHGNTQLWALVDPDKPTITRTFEIYGTGHEVKDHQNLFYISTIQVAGGTLIFHVFERQNRHKIQE
jgi:hypothetical protein